MYLSKYTFNLKYNKGIKKSLKLLFLLKKFINNKRYLKQKEIENKEFLDNINNIKLDENQRKIVLSEEDSTLVIAGAGSGKSLTILARILYLVKNKIDPRDILVISFTNDACNSLKQKLIKNNINIEVLTFHKLGRRILKNNGYYVKLVEDNILDNIIKKQLEKQNLKDLIDIKNKNEIHNLQKLLKTFINLFKSNGYQENQFNHFLRQNKYEKGYNKKRHKILLLLAKQIYNKYECYLDKHKCIDFYDMISKSINIVLKDGIYPYKYIIVDEYQDTSLIKCKLLMNIKKITSASFLAVGDDFQSIYRFTGSNLNVFTDFNKYFPYSKVFKLTNTYRNSKELLEITNKFILKNPKQIYKNLTSKKTNKNPIYICYYENNYLSLVKKLKEKINNVTILARNNQDLKSITNSMTVHKSKGLEFENVIIVNLENSTTGFPNKIKNDKFLKYVLNLKEDYPYEEERRIFYVALTRTKNNNYLLVNKNNPSLFVTELLKENSNIKVLDLR